MSSKVLLFGVAMIILCGFVALGLGVMNGELPDISYPIVIGALIVIMLVGGAIRWAAGVDDDMPQELRDITSYVHGTYHNLPGFQGTIVEGSSGKKVAVRQTRDGEQIYIYEVDKDGNISDRPLIVKRDKAAVEISRKINVTYTPHETVDYIED